MTKAEQISMARPSDPRRVSYYFTPLCPKCYSDVVHPMVSYPIYHFALRGIPIPMWACQNPLCLHKWPRATTT
jgi:hypothetical protein